MNHQPYEPLTNLSLNPALSKALAEVTESIGCINFFQNMLDLLGVICAMDAGGAMMFYRNQRPLQLLHRFNPSERLLPEDFYLSGPYALDPLYHMFLRGSASDAYWLREVAPDDFFESEFYRMFYSQIGISDDIFVMWRIDEDTALLFFLERSVHNPIFQPGDIETIRLVLPFVFAASAKHQQLTASDSRPATNDTTHQKVQSTIENFASSLLTKREREVLIYMLRGFSSGMTAQRLSASEGTIKIHRKNIHRKLDICSQAELFSLFINCIPFAAPGSPGDPLEAYQSRPSRRCGPSLLNSQK